MALPKIEEARNLSDEALADAIVAAKRQLFELRLQKATRQMEKTHEFKHTRHKIAQLLTVERERQRAAEQSEVTTAAQPEIADTPVAEEE
ncbi:50S ribosomal protein L29 [Lusitaniella coriacea LEGE 07157]|uniref:Large ribosomal subunit protein uL29 n=1 Tax=Lusitaniella coriacea LEGE 07157 TaxID=945747 RepID=A0A8J7J1H9_9CYAN|nr:50S ribosomal protein L29 [Lusitaniella coriacea]MBE9115789.1 50S ribosomal protein L29 [Lusitaniella coriacea LEGE 07157]